MKKCLTVTKVTRLLKIADIVQDMLEEVTDEELLKKYSLSWTQLEKVYNKLFYGGFLSREQLVRRMELRSGKDCCHIPVADVQEMDRVYGCEVCGFTSPWHFSACPRCRQVNLRRLTRGYVRGLGAASPAGRYAGG